MFADRYISRNVVYPEFINQKPDRSLGMVVVIPCYREPDVLQTLQSLIDCKKPLCKVEVIVLVNQPENESREIADFNRGTFRQLQEWKEKYDHADLQFFPVYPKPFPKKTAGAGMARKTGMDEAIRRFHTINKPDGILVSLDADTTVSPDYLIEIEKHFADNPANVGATIRFQHRTDPVKMSEKQIAGIKLYERYLYYYKNALAYTGYPFALFTIGSAFCCRGDAYVKQGGMNRRQAGEDFYFLHKLSQLGAIGEINTTCVYPSARLSDRVPFGTGPVLQRWMDGQEDLTMTSRVQAFVDLKLFFDRIGELYKIDEDTFDQMKEGLPVPFQQFLNEDYFYNELLVINQNSASIETFRKRFFQVFNAFKVLKYINFSHASFYSKQNISEAENELSAQLTTNA